MDKTTKEAAIKQNIIQLILKWKLSSAEVEIQKNEYSLSDPTRRELKALLDEYRGYDKIMFSVQENCDKNPVTARMMMGRIPHDILITHPSYRRVNGKLQKKDDDTRIKAAMKKLDEADRFIRVEMDQPKGEDALEAAKDIYPNWVENQGVRDRIEELSRLSGILGEGLWIQQEISALRETGGQAAYQRALELLNQYETLDLESLGIKLFDVEEEREALLRMMVRADGSSWTYRLTPSASQEIIRLEQSIRSLEDAENKNLRVLINNNSRLLTVLIQEYEKLEPDSEQAIQAQGRIAELREKNQRLQTDILAEVANRSEEYCRQAWDALREGELGAAESNIRMAAETGKPAGAGEDDYLGEVPLPTSVSDEINKLQGKLKEAQETRARVRKEIEEIRKQFYNEDDLTLNKLFSWKTTLDNCVRDDPHAPGLEQLHQEIRERYSASVSYLMERTAFDIDNDLQKGDPQGAAARLDTVTPYFSTDEQKDFMTRQLKKINRAEGVSRKSQSMMDELTRLSDQAVNSLVCTDGDLESAKNLAKSIKDLYGEEESAQPPENAAAIQRILTRMQILHDSAEQISIFKALTASGPTPDAIQSAEGLEGSPLYELPAVKTLLASFWRGAGLSDKSTEADKSAYFARASRIAQESGNADLQREISATITGFNERNDRGRQINLILESLQGFYDLGNYAAGVDFINNKVSAEERSDQQVQILADKIEQAYRIEQADRLQKEAREAFERDELIKAEELIGQALEFFYTVEGAQLQKSIVSKREDEEKDVRELQSFLDADFGTNVTLDEKGAAQVRYIRERLQRVDKRNIRDLELLGKIGELESAVNQLIDQETTEFVQMQTSFRNQLLSGPEGLGEAADILKRIEARSWINNYRSEIMGMKAELGTVERMYSSLRTVIDQADGFARMGDFRSAKRILSSFTNENLQSYPGWLGAMKEGAERRIDALDAKYQEVQRIFDPNRNRTDTIVARLDEIFAASLPDGEKIFQLETELQHQRLILEKEIGVDRESNPYLRALTYLDEVMRWAEMITEFDFGIEFPQEVFSVEPLYQIRRVGKTLYETIPPLLIEIQPTLARENKWLERRTRVRQALQVINGCYVGPGKIRSSRMHEVEEEIDKITMIALLDAEKKALDGTVDVIRKYRRRRSLLIAAGISLVIILAALYYFLPWIAEQLGIG